MLNDHTNEAVAVLAGVGIGAALMYFLDPQRGNARRTQAVDRAGGLVRDARWDVETTRRDLRNRVKGVAAETRNRLEDEGVPDEVLSERVRAELGHHVDSLRSLEVVADNARVTLRGAINAEDHDEIVKTARRVRGVEAVDDQLTDS